MSADRNASRRVRSWSGKEARREAADLLGRIGRTPRYTTMTLTEAKSRILARLADEGKLRDE